MRKTIPGNAEMTQSRVQSEILSIEDILHALPDKPVATTRHRGWSGITVDIYDFIPNYPSRVPAHDHHLVCYCPSGSGRIVQRRGGESHSGTISAGMSLIIPAGYDSSWEGDAAPSARMRIPTALIASAAEEICPQRDTAFELRNVFETRDMLIERFALTIIGEIDRASHPAQVLLVETVSAALAAHLVRSFNHHDAVATPLIPRLSPRELSRLTDYIEDHLHRPIGLSELADLVNVSRFHFARLFRQSTGMTAIHYVERRRIQRAQVLIATTDTPLSDIALIVGYSDQSCFTRRFNRHNGCTPAVYAREHGRRRSKRSA
jgi:AraC family transcriptional regulator